MINRLGFFMMHWKKQQHVIWLNLFTFISSLCIIKNSTVLPNKVHKTYIHLSCSYVALFYVLLRGFNNFTAIRYTYIYIHIYIYMYLSCSWTAKFLSDQPKKHGTSSQFQIIPWWGRDSLGMDAEDLFEIFIWALICFLERYLTIMIFPWFRLWYFLDHDRSLDFGSHIYF